MKCAPTLSDASFSFSADRAVFGYLGVLCFVGSGITSVVSGYAPLVGFDDLIAFTQTGTVSKIDGGTVGHQ